MDGSPGNTLRERNRRINSPPTSPIQDDPDDGTHIEMLQSSPGSRRSHDVQPSRVSHQLQFQRFHFSQDFPYPFLFSFLCSQVTKSLKLSK